MRHLLELYQDRVVKARGEAAETAYGYAIGVISATPVPTLAGLPRPLGDWKLSEVTTDTIEQFRDARKASGTTGANRHLGTLQAAFSWAASRKRHLIDDSPFRDGDKPAIERFEERARARRLQGDEADRLLAACGDHLRGIVECALETGMRRGEILSLQWSEVKFAPKPQIVLPAWKTKTDRDRTIPISSRLKAILEMRRHDPAGDAHPPDAYVFGTATGRGSRVQTGLADGGPEGPRAPADLRPGREPVACVARRLGRSICTSTISGARPARGGSTAACPCIRSRRGSATPTSVRRAPTWRSETTAGIRRWRGSTRDGRPPNSRRRRRRDGGKTCKKVASRRVKSGRGERIRTSDPSVPNRVLYQAEPRPDNRPILPHRPQLTHCASTAATRAALINSSAVEPVDGSISRPAPDSARAPRPSKAPRGRSDPAAAA